MCYDADGVRCVKGRILVAEDDPAILKLLETNLQVAGYQVVCAADGQQALQAARTQVFDLALLDVMMPEMDGFALLPYLREQDIPVIFVSAKADVLSCVQGLRLGAEDYLVKPFDILELLVRMEKVLERSRPQAAILTHRDVVLDESSHVVMQGDAEVPLKPLEYELLRTFMRYPGMVLTREQLLRRVWGENFLGETRTIDVHVALLRRKLNWQEVIVTVYKVGYRLEQDV